MQVAQRDTSATGTGYKTIDRLTSQGNGSQAVTQSQDTDVPAGQGFPKSLKFDCTTANASPSAGNYLAITHRIEAQDLQHISNGNSGAKKLTLSFWVKSPKTGNHAVGLYKQDSTQRQNTKTYSVSSANTWEKKTITFDGDTSGGGIANDNGLGIQIDWHLLAGSNFTSVDSTSWVNYSDAAWAYGHAVNVLDNTANNFYLTGVQLEIGSTATDFEHRSYGDELARCQRYYQKYKHGTYKGINFIGRKSGSDTVVGSMYGFPPMRAAATGSVNNAGAYRLYRTTDATTHVPSSVTVTHENDVPYNVLKVTVESAGTFSTGNLCTMYNTSAAGELELDAEL